MVTTPLLAEDAGGSGVAVGTGVAVVGAGVVLGIAVEVGTGVFCTPSFVTRTYSATT